MSGLWGIHPAAAAAGAAVVGAGVTHAFHSRGTSKSRRRTNQATFVVEQNNANMWKRLVFGAKSDAGGLWSETAIGTGVASATDHHATATFPLQSRSSERGVLYDANGEAVVIDTHARFGAKELFLASVVSGALAAAVTRALASGRETKNDEPSAHDISSEASHEITQEIRGGNTVPGETRETGLKPLGRAKLTSTNANAQNVPDARSGVTAAQSTDIAQLRVLMEQSPSESPLGDSDFEGEDWMGSVEESQTTFATPWREALCALHSTARGARNAGTPFPTETVREMELLIARASASVSASQSGAATPVGTKRAEFGATEDEQREHRLPTEHRTEQHFEHLPTSLDRSPAVAVEVGCRALEVAFGPGPALAAASSFAKLGTARVERRADCGDENISLPSHAQSALFAPETPSPHAVPLSTSLDVARLAKKSGSSGSKGACQKSEGRGASDVSVSNSNAADTETNADTKTGDETSAALVACAAADAARARVREAEARYALAQARLQKASSVVSKSRASSAMHTPRSGVCDSNDSNTNAFARNNGGESAGDEIRAMETLVAEVLQKAHAARARIASVARRASTDAREAETRVRTEFSNTRGEQRGEQTEASSASARRLSSSAHHSVPAHVWASADEIKGKGQVFDRFMESLGDIRNGTVGSDGDGEEGGGEVTDANGEVTDANEEVTDGNEEVTDGNEEVTDANEEVTDANEEVTDANQSETTEPPCCSEMEKKTEKQTQKPALRVALFGAPAEGETLTLRVDTGSLWGVGGLLQSEETPLTLRWQRGLVDFCDTKRSAATQKTTPPLFKTIAGAEAATYVLTKTDVGCLVRAVAATGTATGGEHVFASAVTDRAVTARVW
jgi:hypothetical protein